LQNFLAFRYLLVANSSVFWHKCYSGSTFFWGDHFGAARFVVVLSGIAHFVAGLFWSGPFLREFHEHIFFLLLFSFSNFSIFLIYKNYFFRLSFIFFQKP